MKTQEQLDAYFAYEAKLEQQTNMNTEHYKAASERTDEAERALTPAFKRTTIAQPEVSVQHVDDWQYEAYCILQSARTALNGHRDKPTVALADKWIAEAMQLITKD